MTDRDDRSLQGRESVAWDAALSRAAGLRPADLDATGPALGAVRAERQRLARLRAARSRWAAGLAVAAVLAGTLVTAVPRPADPGVIYDAYREASAGW